MILAQKWPKTAKFLWHCSFNGEGSNGHYRSWCIRELRQERPKVSFKKNRRFSPREITRRKCQISKYRVHAVVWGGIPKTIIFVQRVWNQILESCFQSRPLEDISLYWFTKWYRVTCFYVMPKKLLVAFYLQNVTVLSNSTHFKTLKSARLYIKDHI